MNNSFKVLIINKINKLKEIVKNVIRSNQFYKTMGFLEANDLNSCIIFAENIFLKLNIKLEILTNETSISFDENQIIDEIQSIIYQIATLISLYGCDTLENLIYICIGHKFNIEEKYKSIYNLLNCYIRPMRYKTLDWKKKKDVNKDDEIICKNADNFECFDLDCSNSNFQTQIYGIKYTIHNIEKQNTIVVYGIIEDIMIDLVDNKRIKNTIFELREKIPEGHVNYNECSYDRFIKCITLKELLIFDIEYLSNKYINYIEDYNNNINKKSIIHIINDFENKELIDKRNELIMLLINSTSNECHYLAYLLYDLLSNDINGIIDTYEQITIYDSLPYYVKKYFHNAMKETINYTKKLSNFDITKLTLEQRICLMKTDDIVKEKAMVKLKEVKLKSEDTGSKAMQYLDGLVKIPFGIYKEEPVLRLMSDSNIIFSKIVDEIVGKIPNIVLPFPYKKTYTSFEVQKYYSSLNTYLKKEIQNFLLDKFKLVIDQGNKTKIVDIYNNLKHFLKTNTIFNSILPMKSMGKNITELKNEVKTIIYDLLNDTNTFDNEIIYEYIQNNIILEKNNTYNNIFSEFNKNINIIQHNMKNVNTFMNNVSDTLDKSVYGHNKAKRQIERIIGQWMNGDITGYCFGFEGPPGVGKTSLAKNGISRCLNDENNISRPFSFIAMGGSTNSSTLDGHNYTYVGSTWGKIVDILMDTKIMNPIIFIDELDKVSKTENGKEIIGILTHLIDQTQNDTFQDKYFNGINLNLSRALFIFSYNDVDSIDRILLDRIHRIKFEHLSLDDKLIIVRKFILPEIYQKMGLNDMIEISDSVIEEIINDYTCEPGVRKLKELIFEIVGEINLDILKNNIGPTLSIPITITIDDIKDKYLKEHNEIRPFKIHNESNVGVINGLWANSLGKGGVLPIECSFFPANSFLELKLTGMQGDVMKESMNVAKSLAWSLFIEQKQTSIELQKKLDETKNQGLHIHVPEGATPKDGPSAGTAITMVLYSLFSNRRIKNDIAITGEICLQGRVTAIGGLELKILGGIRAGIKLFIYPRENEIDFKKFMDKYGKKSIINDIKFISVETINEVMPLIFIE